MDRINTKNKLNINGTLAFSKTSRILLVVTINEEEQINSTVYASQSFRLLHVHVFQSFLLLSESTDKYL
jgi:hypothetical protein